MKEKNVAKNNICGRKNCVVKRIYAIETTIKFFELGVLWNASSTFFSFLGAIKVKAK